MSKQDYGKSFNQWVESTVEVFVICPKCNSDKGHYDNFFSHYTCDSCNYMDFENKMNWKYDRRNIIG